MTLQKWSMLAEEIGLLLMSRSPLGAVGIIFFILPPSSGKLDIKLQAICSYATSKKMILGLGFVDPIGSQKY